MTKIIFVCHGSICRSPAAEMIFKEEIRKRNLENSFTATSLALTNEELGNDIYPPMKRALENNSIKYSKHSARKLTQDDLDKTDYLFYMDKSNERILSYLINDKDNKCKPIYYYSKGIDEIEDPWYTSRYQVVLDQIKICIKDILDNIH